MPIKTIIIHPDLIIREGLSSLINSLFDLPSLTVSKVSDLASYEEWKGSKLIFLADYRINQDDFQVQIDSYKSENEVKIVLIREPGSETECDEGCSCCFYTNATRDRIEGVLKSFIINESPIVSRSKNSGLTDREIDVVTQVALGKTNKEIADQLNISIHTVISHRKNITEKLGIKSISGLTVYAILNNLIDANTIDPESLI
jgi:DNA-binding CsgD family transcriptional regulator